MVNAAFSEIVAYEAKITEPQLIDPLGIRVGGVDPLGLRQINFDLMDLVIPGLNNVARHIRPFTVIAWAWNRAAICAQNARRKITLDELQDFVDRIEVIFAWSQFVRDDTADLPGRDVLASLLRSETYKFGGVEWKRRRDKRRFSTALSAPVNYGPAVKALGWIEPSAVTPGAFRSSESVGKALKAFSVALKDVLDHPAFSTIGPVSVTRDAVKNWSRRLSILKPTAEEKSAMRESLAGETASEELKKTAETIVAVSKRSEGEVDPAMIRSRMCLSYRAPSWLQAFAPVPTYWTLVQIRQIFRLALEALLFWTLTKLGTRPMRIGSLARSFLAETVGAPTTEKWLRDDDLRGMSIPGHLENLKRSLAAQDENLAQAIRDALAASLAHVAISPIHERSDRLPLVRAKEEMRSFAQQPPVEFLKHVLNSWIFGQHLYWSLGRGLADARSNGKTILRLRAVSEEGGWTLAPGAPLNSPRPTPDRLDTLLSLMHEADLFD